jgi:hypothetical protein
MYTIRPGLGNLFPITLLCDPSTTNAKKRHAEKLKLKDLSGEATHDERDDREG